MWVVMMKKNIIIYISMIFIMSYLCVASSSWSNFGDTGFNYGGGVANLMFSSPYL